MSLDKTVDQILESPQFALEVNKTFSENMEAEALGSSQPKIKVAVDNLTLCTLLILSNDAFDRNYQATS